ncbi:MAG: NAD(P)H-dependent oxidoreductase [Filimonas sp.]|nr:NAD(P)H-dependent oxidoreductase [Filimonas sp.]
MELLESLEWRYATKQFDADRKIDHAQLTYLKRAIQLSPSSYGLQLYKVLIVSSEMVKAQLKPLAWGQSQISDCSHLFIFCNFTTCDHAHIDAYISQATREQNLAPGQLDEYKLFIKEKIAEKQPAEMQAWLQQQPYLAVSNLLTACAALQIDACPMEGFDAAKINQVLGLPEQHLNALVMVAVGYRHSQDAAQHRKKIRKTDAGLFECR